MKLKYLFTLTLIIQIAGFSYSQNNKTDLSKFWIKENDRVCYIGNSITAGGEYWFFIDLYAHTRYPQLKFESFNCGIAGNSSQDVLNRMNSDILIHRPTIATLKLGMNDVQRDLYSSEKASKETIDKQNDALIEYEKKMSLIAKQLALQNCRLIIFTPSIYDQTAKISTANNFGVNDALGKCSVIAKKLATKYNALLVDFYSVMNRINHEKQLKDSTYTLIGNDRVHPGMPGHLVMAYTFLTALHADSLVSKITVDANPKKVIDAIHCQIKNLELDQNKLSFDVLSYSLPFPIPTEAKPALELVPFTQKLNQELLSVKNLKSGKYLLMMDKDTIGIFQDSDLARGINLSLYPQTPQYRQATQVMDISLKRHNLISGKMRIMAMIEESALKGIKDPNNMPEAKTLLDAQLEKIKGKDYYGWVRDRYADYLEIKPKEKEIAEEIQRLGQEIYAMNRPKEHHYQLIQKK
jgi:GDSL-like Lipase/Acylhydrolase family